MSTRNVSIEENVDPPNTLDQGKTTVNQYATKKTVAVGNLEIALLTTNAVQLKTLLGHKADKDVIWYIGFILVCASLFIQVLNACILVLLGTGNISKERQQHRLVSLNNFSLILSIFVTVINVVLNIVVAIDPDILSQTNVTKVF
jgi:hypothetical protein